MSQRRGWRTAVLGGAALMVAGTLAAQSTALAGSPPAAPGVRLVRLPFPEDDGTLTPYTFQLGYQLMTLVYDTLFWRDVDGTPQPWLARSAEVSDDHRTVTLRLADGARWQDGPPVTSADVAFTFAYMASHHQPRFSGELEAVAQVETPDPSIAVVRLRHPVAGFLDQPLADVPILPAHLWASLAPGQVAPPGLPVGSGPYRLVAHDPASGYRFEADPGYFRGPPAVATIRVPIIGEAEATFTALEHRQVDMIPVDLPQDAAARFQGTGIHLLTGTSYTGTALLFNTRTPPFDRVEARRAVSEAIDPPRIARTAGPAVAADHGYIHPASPWAAPAVLHTGSAEAARADLARLGLPPLHIVAPVNDPFKVEAAREVVLALERAGASADVSVVSRDDAAHRIGADGSIPSFDMAISDISPLGSDDPGFLRRVFSTSPGAASFDYTGYHSATFDSLAATIESTTDASARHLAVDTALRLLETDAPVVPLYFPAGAFAYRPSAYAGWSFVKGSGILDKRSFLEPRPAPADTAPGIIAAGGSGPPLGWVAAGAGVAAFLAGGAILVRRRRR